MTSSATQVAALAALYSPDMARIAERLESGERFTEQEQADAAHALAQANAPRQPALPLKETA